MKLFILLAGLLVAAGGPALADDILIYKSSSAESITANSTTAKFHVHDFFIFDLETRQFEDVTYYGKKTKNYSVSPLDNFTPAELIDSSKASSYIVTDGTNSVAGGVHFFGFLYLSGKEKKAEYSLGGNTSGKFPAALVGYEKSVQIDDNNETTSGGSANYAMVLELGMTKESNDAQDDITGAVQIVTSFLTSKGYISAH